MIGALSALIRTSSGKIRMDFIIRLSGLDWLREIIQSSTTSSRTLRKVLLIVYDLMVKETDPSMECEEYKGNLVQDGMASMSTTLDYLL